MKKKLTAFIIGAAIWFGMTDAARQMDSLQSGASNLVARTTMFLFSFGRDENAPQPKEKKSAEPFAPSSENALAAETNTRETLIPAASQKTNNRMAHREVIVAAKHSKEEAIELNDAVIRVKDFNSLIALADEISVNVHSQMEGRVSAIASLVEVKDSENRQRAILRKVAALQRMAVGETGKKYEVKYSFDSNQKAPKPAQMTTPRSLQSCPIPVPVSPEFRKLKTVLLVPEVMKQFGE